MKQDQKVTTLEGMKYNSDREKLVIPEYGRHVQKMINYAKTIDDRDQRQMFVDLVVKLMGQITPNAKPSAELTNKLWNHAFLIGNYELDVDVPKDVDIVEHKEKLKPPKLEYPTPTTKFRHYGSNVQELIDKACEIEDEEKQKDFAIAIGSYMKMAYRNWHKENYVSDEMIRGDMKAMSKGKIDLGESVEFNFLNTQHHKNYNQNRKRSNSGGRGRKGGRSRRRR